MRSKIINCCVYATLKKYFSLKKYFFGAFFWPFLAKKFIIKKFRGVKLIFNVVFMSHIA